MMKFINVLKISIFLFIVFNLLLSGQTMTENSPQKSKIEGATIWDSSKLDANEILDFTQNLDERIQRIEEKLENPSKDVWDKFASISTFLSGVIVALIGILATIVYNRRQLDSQRIQKDREISILRVQTVEKFFIHFSSKNQNIRRAALDTIRALGDEELAARLAKHFGGESGAAVLASLSKSADPLVASSASAALKDLFSALRQSVLIIRSGEPEISLCTGFFVSSDGLVFVPSFALSKEPFKIEIPLSGESYIAELVKRDDNQHLALLRVELAAPAIPIKRFEDQIETGELVVALGYAGASGWKSTVGRITGEIVDRTGSNRIASDIETHPGMAGAPVVNTRGELIGVAESKDAQGTRLLIPAKNVLKFLGQSP